MASGRGDLGIYFGGIGRMGVIQSRAEVQSTKA